MTDVVNTGEKTIITKDSGYCGPVHGHGYGYGDWGHGHGRHDRGLEGKDASFLIGSKILEGQANSVRDSIQVLREIGEARRDSAADKAALLKEVFEGRLEAAREHDKTRELILRVEKERADAERAHERAELLALRLRCGDLRACTVACPSTPV